MSDKEKSTFDPDVMREIVRQYMIKYFLSNFSFDKEIKKATDWVATEILKFDDGDLLPKYQSGFGNLIDIAVKKYFMQEEVKQTLDQFREQYFIIFEGENEQGVNHESP